MYLNNYKCVVCNKTFDIDFPDGEGSGEISCPECGKKYNVTISNQQLIIVPKKAVKSENFKAKTREESDDNPKKSKNVEDKDISKDKKNSAGKYDSDKDNKSMFTLSNILKFSTFIIVFIIVISLVGKIFSFFGEGFEELLYNIGRLLGLAFVIIIYYLIFKGIKKLFNPYKKTSSATKEDDEEDKD